MKLGLFIANLETLRATHGADVEVIGALVDVVKTGEMAEDPDDYTQVPYVAAYTPDAPVYLLISPPQCPHCGGNH